MIFNKISRSDDLNIYEYDFIETDRGNILKNINFCINEGTIL